MMIADLRLPSPNENMVQLWATGDLVYRPVPDAVEVSWDMLSGPAGVNAQPGLDCQTGGDIMMARHLYWLSQ